MPDYSRKYWFTFPTRTQVEQPIIWQMSHKFPDVMFDIRQASVQHEIGIMAVLLSGNEADVKAAVDFLRSKGLTVEPIERTVVEGKIRRMPSPFPGMDPYLELPGNDHDF